MPPKPIRKTFAHWRKRISRELGVELRSDITLSYQRSITRTGRKQQLETILREHKDTIDRITKQRLISELVGKSQEGAFSDRGRKRPANKSSRGNARTRYSIYLGEGLNTGVRMAPTIAHELGHQAYSLIQGLKETLPKNHPKKYISEVFGIHYELEYFRIHRPTEYKRELRIMRDRYTAVGPHSSAVSVIEVIYKRYPTQKERKKFFYNLSRAKMETWGDCLNELNK